MYVEGGGGGGGGVLPFCHRSKCFDRKLIRSTPPLSKASNTRETCSILLKCPPYSTSQVLS